MWSKIDEQDVLVTEDEVIVGVSVSLCPRSWLRRHFVGDSLNADAHCAHSSPRYHTGAIVWYGSMLVHYTSTHAQRTAMPTCGA